MSATSLDDAIQGTRLCQVDGVLIHLFGRKELTSESEL